MHMRNKYRNPRHEQDRGKCHTTKTDQLATCFEKACDKHHRKVRINWYTTFERVLSIHCLAALDRGQVPRSWSIVLTVRPCSPWGSRWIGYWRTSWTVCSSTPNSQAAEWAISRLCEQERKRPTAAQRRLSRTHAVHSTRVGADVGDESTESRSAVKLFRCWLINTCPEI